MKAWGLVLTIVLACAGCSSGPRAADPPGAAAAPAPLRDPENFDRADTGFYLIRGTIEPGRQPDGNTAVLEGKGGLIVFDTGRHAWHTQKIVDYAAQKKLPVVAILNSHWHLDHNSGNPMLLERWPGAAVYSSDAALTEALGAFLARGAENNRKIIADGTAPALQIEEAKTDLATVEGGTRLHPTIAIEKTTTLTLAGRRIDAHFARGASAGDIWLYDPAAKLVATGDLITLPAPFLDTACPSAWTAAFAEILAQPFERAIPGHGREMTRADVIIYRDAFNALLACAASSAEPAACADQWGVSVASLLDGPQADGRAARAYARYYVESVLRPGAVRADCPK